jgi:hypothetical protein
VAALALMIAGILGLAGVSKAAPVTLKFDHGRATLGSLLPDQAVLPASDKFPSDSLPLPQRTDIELSGTEEGGQLSFPASQNTGLAFPYMGVDHPVEQGLKIPFTFRLKGPGLTGTWDPTSGAATLEGTLDIIVITGQGSSFPLPDSFDDVGVPSLGLFARCRFSDVPVSFSTSNLYPYAGRAFSGGFGVDGVLSTFWRSLPDPVSENGGDCDQVRSVTFGVGGVWLSNGIADAEFQLPPLPTCENDPTLCPEPEPAASITGLRLAPKSRTARQGRRIVLRLGVKNSGDAAAERLVVRLRSSNRRVRVPTRIVMVVPPGEIAIRRLAVRVGASARGRSVITATAAGLRSASRVAVVRKAAKRPRRGR